MVILKTRNLNKKFGGLLAINDVNLDINQGEILGLIGPNGSGKTTFLNLINGIFRPTSGKVVFDGENVTGFPPHVLARKGIGRTFQQNILFKMATVWDNVLLSHEAGYRWSPWESFFKLPRSRLEEKNALQSTADILEEMKLLGWKDKVCSSLPHGIQRMVEIAVAIAVKPKLMLLDEPFAGVNLTEIQNMSNEIRRLKQKGVTILMVEHRMKAVMDLCDRIVALNFGEKIAEGLPEEIKNNDEVVRAYLGDKDYVF